MHSIFGVESTLKGYLVQLAFSEQRHPQLHQELTSSPFGAALMGTIITPSPGHTPLHCAVLAHNTLLRDRGRLALPEQQSEELQHQSWELETCVQQLVQAGASIYSRVGTASPHPSFVPLPFVGAGILP